MTPQPLDAAAPSSRAKHSATLLGGHLYLLGGRNGNVGLKDFWRYSIGKTQNNLFLTNFKECLSLTLKYKLSLHLTKKIYQLPEIVF